MLCLPAVDLLFSSDIFKAAFSLSFYLPAGSLPEDHREERIPGPAVGALHHPKRR